METTSGRLYQSLRERAMNREAFTMSEIEEAVREIQEMALRGQLPVVNGRVYQNAIDDLCRMIVWLCKQSTDSTEQRYLTDKLTAVAAALNI